MQPFGVHPAGGWCPWASPPISTEPLKTFVAGLLAIFVPPVLAMLAVVTVVGLPLGIGLLFRVIPTLAFAGYLVAGIWLGERVIDAGRVRQRPYLASIVGLLLLLVLSIIPIVAAVAALFGLGAIVLAGWRTLRSTGPRRTAVMTQVQAAPAGA